jgi:hypothetical protein
MRFDDQPGAVDQFGVFAAEVAQGETGPAQPGRQLLRAKLTS